ncbi:hypothetical protein V8F20_012640 [Naviculisporaceae sp. PSN 640]
MEIRSKASLKDICCLAISLVLQNKVHFPGSPGYTASLGSYASLQEIAVQPRCIVTPQSTHDVSTAVRILSTTTLAGSSRGCQFAIRSGGHGTFAGYANIEGGVTLDLSGLNSITVQTSSSPDAAPIVSVGTGAHWGAVYSTLDPLNLSVNGGRAASVGVGGLTLGGGLSFFGPRYGWTCDTVTNFEVVLFDGRVVNANSNSNSDLLWALRGGTNNFGVVTRIDLQSFPQGNLWGGQEVHTMDALDAQMSFLASFSDPATYDEYSSLITSFAYNNPATGGPAISVIVNQIEYTQPVANPPAFQPLTEGLPPPLFSTQRITNLTDITTEVANGNPNGVLRQFSATLTIQAQLDAINATVQAWNNSVPSVSHIPGLIWTVVMDPLPPQLYSQHSDSGTANALGISSARTRNESLMIVQLYASWPTPSSGNAEEFDDVVDLAARNLIADIETTTRALGALDRFVYANYAAPWQNVFASYGPAVVEKLRGIRRRYDPAGVFTKMVPGGFKF